MKKLSKKLFLPLLIIISMVFGAFPINSVYAIEGENETDEVTEIEPDSYDSVTNRPTNTTDGELNPINPDPDDPNAFISVGGHIDQGDAIGNMASGNNNSSDNSACKQQTDSLQWIICPVVNITGKASDYLYNALTDILQVNPVSMENDQPIYLVWIYARDLTNIVFVILILVAIYSQFTGLGISNYGIKRALPRLIIAAIMVNLSFIICSLAVDLSNVIGSSLQGVFDKFLTDLFSKAPGINMDDFSWSALSDTLTGGVLVIGGGLPAVAGIETLFWLILVAMFGVVMSLIAGIITIGLRQGVIAILIMLAPLAIIAYILPNTEKLFRKWRELGMRMLVFYPLFSLLYGASKLIGWALIISASGPFGIVLGMVIMVAPLFLSISLMKMSGTVLGNVYGALTKAFAPINRTVDAWGRSHAEQAKQNYMASNIMPGARLRNYLAYRQALREHNTNDAKTIVEGRAQERALIKSSSYIGLDDFGNATWKNRANRYTRTAKRASLMKTRVGTAESALQNTLSAYGDHFGQGTKFAHRAANRLSTEHAKAFEGAMIQEFLTANEAQNDQEYLLNQYLKAAKGRYDNPYEFNRLIKNAAGGLGHNGESSIMGQVIQKSVEIENRRRREALVVMNKFGVDKPTSRAMIFNVAAIDDDGFEVDPVTGKKVEDMHHNLIGQHHDWAQFIAVHKKTGKELTAEEYSQLTSTEREQYERVRYFDITDDKGMPVQRVYSDDVGYMKELLVKDITIGDPINRRYNYSIGVPNSDAKFPNEHNAEGLIRRYHSTITSAMQSTAFKQHSAEVTAMLLAQADNGYINGPQQYNIANLDSMIKSSTPGDILRNDAFTLDDWRLILDSLNTENEQAVFDKFFPEAAIANYRNVNGKRLKGLRLDADAAGNLFWKEIDRNAPDLTVDDQRNFIKHSMLPAAARKLYSALNRAVPPDVSAKQKGDGVQALQRLEETLIKIGWFNEDTGNNFNQRLNPSADIFDAPDPNTLRTPLEYNRLLKKYNDGKPLTKREQKFLNDNYVSTPAAENVKFSTRGGGTTSSGSSGSGSYGGSGGSSGGGGFFQQLTSNGIPIRRIDDEDYSEYDNNYYDDYGNDDYYDDLDYDDEEPIDSQVLQNHNGMEEIQESGLIYDPSQLYQDLTAIFDANQYTYYSHLVPMIQSKFYELGQTFSDDEDVQECVRQVNSIIAGIDGELKLRSSSQAIDDLARNKLEKKGTELLRQRILGYIGGLYIS